MSLPAGAAEPITQIPAVVDFSDLRQSWDGFGLNYVETAQTRDYAAWPQDHGGFSLLSEEQKDEVIRLVFSPDGLDVPLIKMFLDPWHQAEPGGAFDHTTTCSHLLRFAEGGARLRDTNGDGLRVLTTLYGPPAWATKQRVQGGRDPEPERFVELADYLIDWVKFLRLRHLDVAYLGPHNEGEDFYRWDFVTGEQRLERFDYNAYWPPELLNEFLAVLDDRLTHHGLQGVGVTNGEPSNWTRMTQWGYQEALARDRSALDRLDLLTTHGFVNGNFAKMSFSMPNGTALNRLRALRPELRSWVTSYSWAGMDTEFLRVSHEHIYTAGVNGLIPWAGIQSRGTWLGGGHLDGCAIKVSPDGEYEVTRGYYFYKQLTQAGKPGMRVAGAMLANPLAFMMAFAGADSDNPDAFVVVSDIDVWRLPIGIEVRGSKYTKFRAHRSNMRGDEEYKDLGVYAMKDGVIEYDPPTGSVTTFIGVE